MIGAVAVTVVVAGDPVVDAVVGVGDELQAAHKRENSASALVACRRRGAHPFIGGVYVFGVWAEAEPVLDGR